MTQANRFKSTTEIRQQTLKLYQSIFFLLTMDQIATCNIKGVAHSNNTTGNATLLFCFKLTTFTSLISSSRKASDFFILKVPIKLLYIPAVPKVKVSI